MDKTIGNFLFKAEEGQEQEAQDLLDYIVREGFANPCVGIKNSDREYEYIMSVHYAFKERYITYWGVFNGECGSKIVCLGSPPLDNNLNLLPSLKEAKAFVTNHKLNVSFPKEKSMPLDLENLITDIPKEPMVTEYTEQVTLGQRTKTVTFKLDEPTPLRILRQATGVYK